MELVALFSFVTILLCAFFTFLTTALNSVSHAQLTVLMEKGSDSARRIHNWRQTLDFSTTSLVIAQTFFQIVGSIAVGVTLYVTLPVMGYFLLAVVLFFLLFMFFGRVIPRILGMRYANNVVGFTASSVNAVTLVLKPAAAFVQYLYGRYIPEDNRDDEASREEIDEILESAHQEGSLDSDEYRILKSIMRYSDVQVSDVMTPRIVVFACSADMTISEAVKSPELTQYSRFPIYDDESLDSVSGYVMTRDLLRAMVEGKSDLMLRDIAREVYFIPENVQLDRALENFLERRQHLFVVVDEYGGVEGLITMEDVVETILGVEIVDEADNVIDLRQLAKQRRDKRVAAVHPQQASDAPGTAGKTSTGKH